MRDSSEMTSDPLSDVLDLLHVRCTLSGMFVAGGTWARRFANLDAIKFCAVTEGSCWYSVDGLARAVRVEAGDVLVMNGTRSLTLASEESLIADATTTPLERDENGNYRVGHGDEFTMLTGMVQIDAERQALLVSGLPPIIHVRGKTPEAAPLAWLLQELVTEMKSIARPGGAVAIAGLAQLLFVHTLRAYLQHAHADDAGWVKGLGDPRLAEPLRFIHRDPARNWSLDELAKEAGMSRTSFAVRFREMMGVPPLTYLTKWRMQLAGRELRSGASIAEAAAAVGYTSESAFSSAFKRFMGVAPGKYRHSSPEARPYPLQLEA